MKKNDNVFIGLGLLAMALAFTSTDIYVPAMPVIRDYFSAATYQVQYTLSTYLFGLAIAQLTAGPIVDHIGCRKIFLPSIVGFIFVSLTCMFAPNIIILIIARTFQALFAGVIGITARASFIRRFDAARTSYIFRTLAPYIILSAVIAPIIGGYIVYYINWQTIFLSLMLYGILLFWLAYNYFHVNEQRVVDNRLQIRVILKNYLTVLQHKPFMQCVVINGIYLGVVFSYLTEAPFIYHKYNYSSNEIGLTFIPIASAFLIASQLTRFLHNRLTMNQFVILAYTLIILGLSIVAIPAYYNSGLAAMTVGISIAVFGMGFSNPVAFGKGMVLFPEKSGTASSLLTALPFIAGTLLTSVVHPVCGDNIIYLALFLFAIATACVVIYYLLGLKK